MINETLSLRLEALTGTIMNTSEPENVVSVLCTPTTGYLGVSPARRNLSAWPGGKHRFKREDGQISRAEFKLLEALSVFGVSLPRGGTALDIGAAPGGWTRVLRAAGLGVVALDPAELDVRLAGDPGVVHVRRRIQDYLSDG
ncbi:MAG: ribosomal large subunit methytransferase, partial [Capsulimonas sp.]|nr:ribosomal large subunit methytransferase [Capsulimonas sp.]